MNHRPIEVADLVDDADDLESLEDLDPQVLDVLDLVLLLSLRVTIVLLPLFLLLRFRLPADAPSVMLVIPLFVLLGHMLLGLNFKALHCLSLL